MAIRMYLAFVVWCWHASLVAQPDQSFSEQKEVWKYNATINAYAFSDALIINPVVTADFKRLHLESRYNYEDLQTISFFAGYTFDFGERLHFEATPMMGFAVGGADGWVPAIEMGLTYGAFEWYNESEYFLQGGDHQEDFFYTWTEFMYYPSDWLMIGFAGARTALYETELEIQRGLGLGYLRGNLMASAYLMNLGFTDPFVYFSVSLDMDR